MNIVETVKEHPIATIAAVAVGLLIIFALVGNSSAPAVQAGGTDPSVQAAQIQSATALAMAQIGAQSEDKKNETAARIAQLTTESALLGRYADNSTAVALQHDDNDAMLRRSFDDNSTALKIAGYNRDTALYSISAQQAVEQSKIQQLTDVAAISAGVNLASISANRDTTLAQTHALADANKYVAQLSADTTRLISNNSASVAKNQSSNNLFGGLISTVGSLLGGLF